MVALKATKEWLLDLDFGVLWVLMRVLACGGFGVLVWEATTGQIAKRKSIEVRSDHGYWALVSQTLSSGLHLLWHHFYHSYNMDPCSWLCTGYRRPGALIRLARPRSTNVTVSE